MLGFAGWPLRLYWDRDSVACSDTISSNTVPWHHAQVWPGYDEGFFAGGKFSGKGVHVDQAGCGVIT